MLGDAKALDSYKKEVAIAQEILWSLLSILVLLSEGLIP